MLLQWHLFQKQPREPLKRDKKIDQCESVLVVSTPWYPVLYLGVLKPKSVKNSLFHMSCTPHRPWLLISSVAAYLDLTGCQGQGIPRSTNTASTKDFEMSWFTEFIWKETTLKDREGNTFFRNGPIKRRDWKKQFENCWLIRKYILFYQYVLSHWLTVSKKSVNRSVLNSWKNEAVDLKSGSAFIHLLFPSKKCQVIFLQDHGRVLWVVHPASMRFFVPRNTSLSTDPASPPVNPEWNHRITESQI